MPEKSEAARSAVEKYFADLPNQAPNINSLPKSARVHLQGIQDVCLTEIDPVSGKRTANFTEYQEQVFSIATAQAVLSNTPEYRNQMRKLAARWLNQHREFLLLEMPPPLLEWLLYIIEYSSDVAHATEKRKPSSKNVRAKLLIDLAEWWSVDLVDNPTASVTNRLERACHPFPAGYDTLKKMYYTDSFNTLVRLFSENKIRKVDHD